MTSSQSENAPTGPEARAGRKEWIALGVLLLPVLLVSMDLTVLYFAIPSISEELRPSGSQQLWMIDIYGFVLMRRPAHHGRPRRPHRACGGCC